MLPRPLAEWKSLDFSLIKLAADGVRRGKVGVRGVSMAELICIWYLVCTEPSICTLFSLLNFINFFTSIPVYLYFFFSLFGRVKWDTQNAAYPKVKGTASREFPKLLFKNSRPNSHIIVGCSSSNPERDSLKKCWEYKKLFSIRINAAMRK